MGWSPWVQWQPGPVPGQVFDHEIREVIRQSHSAYALLDDPALEDIKALLWPKALVLAQSTVWTVYQTLPWVARLHAAGVPERYWELALVAGVALDWICEWLGGEPGLEVRK